MLSSLKQCCSLHTEPVQVVDLEECHGLSGNHCTEVELYKQCYLLAVDYTINVRQNLHHQFLMASVC